MNPSQIWLVYDHLGRFVGTYRARTERDAIGQHVRQQAIYFTSPAPRSNAARGSAPARITYTARMSQ